MGNSSVEVATDNTPICAEEKRHICTTNPKPVPNSLRTWWKRKHFSLYITHDDYPNIRKIDDAVNTLAMPIKTKL